MCAYIARACGINVHIAIIKWSRICAASTAKTMVAKVEKSSKYLPIAALTARHSVGQTPCALPSATPPGFAGVGAIVSLDRFISLVMVGWDNKFIEAMPDEAVQPTLTKNARTETPSPTKAVCVGVYRVCMCMCVG